MIADITLTDATLTWFFAALLVVTAIGIPTLGLFWKLTFGSITKTVAAIETQTDKIPVMEVSIEDLECEMKKLRSLVGGMYNRNNAFYDAMARRAQLGAAHNPSGPLGEFKSPFTVNDRGRSLIPDELLSVIKPFYDTEGCKMTDRDLRIELMARFDNDITEHLCKPHNIDNFQCYEIIGSTLRNGPFHVE